MNAASLISLIRSSSLSLLCFLLYATGASAAAHDNCVLPQALDAKIAARFAGAHVVTLADLSEDNRNLYKKDHGSRCPGLVEINFYGDGKPTWAVILISGDDPRQLKSRLLVAHQKESTWEIRSLATAIGVPVVWQERPGRYKDMYGRMTIRSTTPVIVLCYYNSSTTVYAWNGRKIEEIWLTD